MTVAEQVHLSAYWFSTNFLWAAMLTVLLPTEVLRFVPAGQSAAAVGALTAAGAFIALVVHPVAGAISDRTPARHRLARWLPWLRGRRRPYIFIGNLGLLASLALMAGTGSYAGLMAHSWGLS